MKIMHLSDLHIGIRVNEFNFMQDQRHVLKEILELADRIKPAAILIAGDVYDKSVPSAEAVELFDELITGISERNIPAIIISGNHDSPERLGFGGRIMNNRGIHLCGVFNGSIKKITLADSIGEVDFYLMPFIKPGNVRQFFPDANVETYEDAVRTVIDSVFEAEAGGEGKAGGEGRKVLVAHQFVTGSGGAAIRSDSEVVTVGGHDNVDFSLFNRFDYVALGHLHRQQVAGRDNVRYAGSPLKYSFSEARHDKTVTIVDLGKKGDVQIELIPIKPLRDMREIKGKLSVLLSDEVRGCASTDDYIRAILTDEEDLLDAMGQLRSVYPNIMRLDFENSRTSGQTERTEASQVEEKDLPQLFSEFYKLQQNTDIDEEKFKIVAELLAVQSEGMVEG